jgi:uncharacterized membrane protein
MLAGAAIRHWFNLRGKKVSNYWLLPFAIALLMGLVFYTKPESKNTEQQNTNTVTNIVTDMQVMQIINKHCLSCHAAKPTSTIFAQAPKGLMLDNFNTIKANKDKIKAQAVNAQIMPLGNTTKMTDSERQELGAWIEQLKK